MNKPIIEIHSKKPVSKENVAHAMETAFDGIDSRFVAIKEVDDMNLNSFTYTRVNGDKYKRISTKPQNLVVAVSFPE